MLLKDFANFLRAITLGGNAWLCIESSTYTSRQVPISIFLAFFPRKVCLLIIVTERILSQNPEIPTSKT